MAFCFTSFAFAGLLPNTGGPVTSGAKNESGFVLPFAFVENRGQADPAVRYIGTGPEFKAWFRSNGVVLQQGETAVRLTFAGRTAATTPAIHAADPIGATANYLRGNKPADWRTGLALYGAIHYDRVWPGVDLTYKAANGRVKAEYLVSPGTPVDEIALSFDAPAEIQPDGTLRIHTQNGDFVEDKPVLYQMIGDRRNDVEGGFRELPDGTIGFRVGVYDAGRPLVIDPSILFSGFFGGGSQASITAVGFDLYNNVIVAGWTSSTDLAASAGVKTKNAGGVDAFVASFAPNGGAMTWCTYLGGSGDDRAFGLAIDGSRNIYVTGWTSSVNFPTAGPFQAHLSGTRDAFVAKLSPAGNSLVYSTYLGGSAVDVGYAIALDGNSSAVIVGDTTSANLPVTSHAFQSRNNGAQDAFVAKLSPAGNTLVFLTYLGGAGVDHGASVKLDGAGSVFAGGATFSMNFPAVSALQAHSGGGQDGFVSKLSADGSAMLFSTYLGGSSGSAGAPEEVNGIFVDLLGNVVAAGTTSSANFPVTTGAFQTTLGGQSDGFITRISGQGVLLNSTYLGGSLTDGINAVALDYHGTAYVTGYTVSQDFPVQGGLQGINNGTMNAFAVKMNPTLSAMILGTYIGGSANDTGNAIAVDAQTSIIIAGQTSSGDFPAAGNLPSSLPSQLSSFITKLAPAFTIGVDYISVMVTDPWHVSWFTAVSVFGAQTDLPVVGDWDGTGKKRIGVFSNGTWYLDTNGDGYFDAGDQTVSFGQAGDLPVVGDWSHTGHISLGLFRNGTFILDLSGHLSGVPTGIPDAVYAGFGQAGDLPVAADWNGSGTTKIGVFRNGSWLVDYNGDGVFNGSDRTYTYGQAGDLPVVGDWDSSGHPSKIGVYRNGLWILDYDGDNAWTVPVLNEMVLSFGSYSFLPLVF
jgi:hypothetical protein